MRSAERSPPVQSSAMESCCTLFAEFCDNSSIHGVRYIGVRKQQSLHRFWWIAAFLISNVMCIYLINNLWIKWDEKPVILSFSEHPTNVWEIPFPAVTICPDTKAEKAQFNITNIYARLSAAKRWGVDHDLMTEELSIYEAISQVCDEQFSNFNAGNWLANASLMANIFDKVKVKMDPELFFCKWRNEFDNCTNLLSPILTEEGMCLTFNTMDPKHIFRMENLHQDFQYIPAESVRKGGDWDLDNGFDGENATFPYRVLSSGSRAGLTVLATLFEKDADYVCRGAYQGFRVHLHTPREFPSFTRQFIRVPINQEFIVAIKPKMMATSEALRSSDPKRRQCYFNGERFLRFFQMYSQQNCELECLSNYTMAQCGCVKFSMPRDAKTPVCGARSVVCYNTAEQDLFYQDSFDKLSPGSSGCNCMPSCNSITYDVETSQATYDWRNIFKAFQNNMEEFPGVQFLRFSIQFKETQFISSKRSELYGPTDFLANCGGLLGLFMGVSLLSLVELFYYLTIKVWGVRKSAL